MALKRFSGRKNLVMDLSISIFLSLIFTFIISIYTNDRSVGAFLGSVVAGVICFFFLFFFWSWKPEHVKSDRLVRNFIHCLHGFFIFMIGITVLPHLFIDSSISVLMNYIILAVLAIGVVIKYKKLFWSKKAF